VQHTADPNTTEPASRRVIGAIAITVGAILATIGFSAGPVSGEEPVPTQTVPLNNIEAPTENTPECPNAIDDFWHFVIAGGQGYSFVSITLNLAGTQVTFSGSEIILNPNNQKPDNVYVMVPDGYSFPDLIKAGSSAEIAPATGSVSFVLSHFCDGSGRPTTTTTSTTTTTVPEETTTTTTVPETTTTTTTTTVPETTTTTSTTTTTTSTTTTTVPETTTTTSTTVPETTTTTTTTVPDDTTTTTTVPDDTTTTTTVPDDTTTTTVESSGGTTTTAAPTTSIATQGPTTTLTASAAATTTVATQLPQTGSDLSRSLSVLGLLLVAFGGVMTLTARRTTSD
jgi:LPXTG-motif cell wall-anchored protein